MNSNLSKAFVAIKNNKVVVFDTNLKNFVDELHKLEPGIRNYAYYVRQFAKTKYVEYVNDKNEVYYLQQVFP